MSAINPEIDNTNPYLIQDNDGFVTISHDCGESGWFFPVDENGRVENPDDIFFTEVVRHRKEREAACQNPDTEVHND